MRSSAPPYVMGRSVAAWPAPALPLFASDWLAVHWSALFYGSGLWGLAATV